MSSGAERVVNHKVLINAPAEGWNELFVDKLQRGAQRSTHATDKVEIFDPPEVLSEKVAMLTQLMRDACYVVAYTGAGVLTSANIPDYRRPQGKLFAPISKHCTPCSQASGQLCRHVTSQTMGHKKVYFSLL